MPVTPSINNIFKIITVIIFIILFGALIQRDYFIKSLDTREARVLTKDREESFSGIYFNRDRIGYVKNRLTADESGGYRLRQEAYMVLNILEENHPIKLSVNASLGSSMLMKTFDFELTSPFYSMTAKGEVDGSTVNFTLATGKEEIRDSIRLSKPPFLSTNNRRYLIEQNMAPGEKIKIPYFDPISLSGKDTVLEYKGYEKTLIKGRIHRLHRFIESFSGMRINSWLDDSGNVIKEESPAGFVFLAEPEFKATDIKTDGKEILSSVSVKASGKLPADYTTAQKLSYRLSFPAEAEVSLDEGRQDFVNNTLTIIREKVPAEPTAACSGPEEALASTPYVQSGNAKISAMVNSIINDSMTAMQKVRALSDWVFKNLEKRPVLGIPDALTTLATMRGDCNEHASLFAAMARNAGIPTRIAAGVTFHEGAFYYHAWNEVCVNDNWHTLDTTKDQIPADVTHIKFVEGETSEQIKIGSLWGDCK